MFFFDFGGYVATFGRVFCLAVPEALLGNHSVQCFRKLPLAEKFLNKRGGKSRLFSRKFVVS